MPEEKIVQPLFQGDVLDVKSLPVSSPDSSVSRQDCPHGVVVVSQTCDAVRDSLIQVARIVKLQGSAYSESITGKRPRYIPITVNGESLFADLASIATVDRGEIPVSRISNGVQEEKDRTLFRFLIARRFGRFPFPDAVVHWCKPLREKIAPKARGNGAQGHILRQITCIRILDHNGWDSPSYDLALCFLVKPGILPTTTSGMTKIPSSFLQKVGGMSPNQIASAIIEKTLGDNASVLNLLWDSLIASWIDKCNSQYLVNPAKDGSMTIPVSGIGEILSEDEYTYDRYLASEQLDLDYLSRDTV